MKVRTLLACMALLGAAVAAPAQDLRDPTVPPLGGSSSGAGASRPRTNPGSWPVIVVDGKAHVAVGTRLYAEGDVLGKARIERITETEVWLREGRELRKVQNYPGVRRSNVPPQQP